VVTTTNPNQARQAVQGGSFESGEPGPGDEAAKVQGMKGPPLLTRPQPGRNLEETTVHVYTYNGEILEVDRIIEVKLKYQQRAERRYEAIGDLGACSLNRDGFKEAKLAIEAGEAHAHALWEILKEPTDRDAYMIRPLPWEGPGEYQYVHFHDGTHRYIKVNGFMGIVFEVHGPCKGEPKPEPRNVIVEHAKHCARC